MFRYLNRYKQNLTLRAQAFGPDGNIITASLETVNSYVFLWYERDLRKFHINRKQLERRGQVLRIPLGDLIGRPYFMTV